MKLKILMIGAVVMGLMACASPEERATEQIDTNTVDPADTAGKDTITNVNGRSGDNGTGTDTTNTAEQQAIQEAGKK